MNKQQQAKRIRALGQRVRDGKAVPPGTILGDGTARMAVTGCGWYDMEGNRSDVYKLGWTFMYEGNLVRYSKALSKAVPMVNLQGHQLPQRMTPASVRAVLTTPLATDASSPAPTGTD